MSDGVRPVRGVRHLGQIIRVACLDSGHWLVGFVVVLWVIGMAATAWDDVWTGAAFLGLALVGSLGVVALGRWRISRGGLDKLAMEQEMWRRLSPLQKALGVLVGLAGGALAVGL